MATISNLIRCSWCGTDPLYKKYHDEEWGVPIRDDQEMFSFFVLETFQAGLSWITILRKRENFRKAFANFNMHKVATFTDADVERLMQDAGIIRNRAKILAAINNANQAIKLTQEFGTFCNYWWKWVDHKPVNNRIENEVDVPATSPLSDAISADLKKRGFKFVGSTTVYAHLQAAGLINDHLVSCFRHSEVSSF